MMSSATDASVSSSRWVYWARPGPILARSLVSVACSRSQRARALDAHRAQVADVEDDAVLAAGQMLGDGALRVGQRHFPPAEAEPSSASRAAVGGVRAASVAGPPRAAAGFDPAWPFIVLAGGGGSSRLGRTNCHGSPQPRGWAVAAWMLRRRGRRGRRTSSPAPYRLRVRQGRHSRWGSRRTPVQPHSRWVAPGRGR